MSQKINIALSIICIFSIALIVWFATSDVRTPPVACTEEAMMCPDGSAVGRTGPNCAFAECPAVRPTDTSTGTDITIIPPPAPMSCTKDAKQCPDGSVVGRVPPSCQFATCPVPAPAPGSCRSNADCPSGYSCEDISPVVREGTQNLQCWKNGSPRPICLSGETRIATPKGDMLVKNIKAGDFVWSTNSKGERVAVPVLIASYTKAPYNHQVVHLILSDGRELIASPLHPVADGRTMDSLKVGDTLEGTTVHKATLIHYEEPYTYDILPNSETGMYFGNGILLQSTLKR